MIIIEVMGGLGNQMQQYALYQKMKSLGKEAKLDVSWFFDENRQKSVLAARSLELEWFDHLPMECCTEQEKRALLGKGGFFGKVKKKLLPGTDRHFQETGMYHPEIFELDNAYLSGFWACEKYYADILPKLRELIVFPKQETGADFGDAAQRNRELIERMGQEISVSLHIRRGDYLDPENAAMFGGICTDAYYEAAVRFIRERFPEAHFYVFSDDPAYAKERYREPDFTVVDWNTGKSSLFDMQLMSCCKHNICANSTFSFWGARLNPSKDKIMIRPAKHKNGQDVGMERMQELWEGWKLIDGEGKVGVK
ncbi:MAG: alpha-1,2-fucosyltransferase [Eisenbergiella sp.]